MCFIRMGRWSEVRSVIVSQVVVGARFGVQSVTSGEVGDCRL